VDQATGEIAGMSSAADERSAVAEFGKVRQFSLVHEAIRQHRVHAVEAHDHDSSYLRLAIGLAAAKLPQQLANGPGDQRVKGIKEG